MNQAVEDGAGGGTGATGAKFFSEELYCRLLSAPGAKFFSEELYWRLLSAPGAGLNLLGSGLEVVSYSEVGGKNGLRTWCQFHQHFMSRFCAKILSPKN